MAKYNKMTEAKYNAIKLILQGGASYAEAAKYMQVSEVTVGRIKGSESFAEYSNMMAAQTLEWKKRRAAERAAKAAEKPQEKPHGVDPGKVVPQVQEVRQAVQAQEITHTVQVQATRFMEEQMRQQTELLKQISNKLAVIIDDLYGTGAKAWE